MDQAHPKITPANTRIKYSTYFLYTYADPEKNVRGGQTLTALFLVDEGWEKYHYKRATIGPPAKRHLNGVSLAC